MQIQRTFVTRYDRAEALLASRKTHCVFNILVWDDPLYASDRAARSLCLSDAISRPAKALRPTGPSSRDASSRDVTARGHPARESHYG